MPIYMGLAIQKRRKLVTMDCDLRGLFPEKGQEADFLVLQ
jgi:hypothetical protein